MPAPSGNSNARKWTIKKTKELLKEIEYFSRKDDILFLSQALEKVNLYKTIWTYWKKIWADEEDIIYRIEMIEQRFEYKLIMGAVTRRFHAGFARAQLRRNYGFNGTL